jgi:murein L,D-transpeptidase YafK
MRLETQIPVWTLAVVLSVAAFPRQTVPQSQSSEAPQVADRIVVVKSTRTMTLESKGHTLKTYKVALGGQPVGAKERQGDHKTPEGEYAVNAKNAHSQFYKALHLSYPNAADRLQARKLGVSPGGDVEIHGLGKEYGWIGARHRLTDWTDGCVAVTNEEIEEIFKMVEVGTRVEIRP